MWNLKEPLTNSANFLQTVNRKEEVTRDIRVVLYPACRRSGGQNHSEKWLYAFWTVSMHMWAVQCSWRRLRAVSALCRNSGKYDITDLAME